MSIKFIDLFSNTINPRKFKPEISIKDNTISISPDTFYYDGYEFVLDEQVDIDIELPGEDSYLKVYFVEELQTKELIVVADHVKKSEIGTGWNPNPETHRVLFNPIDGFIPPSSAKLEDGEINVYSLDFVEQFQNKNAQGNLNG